MSHALCSRSGSPTQDSLRPKLLYSLSLLDVLSVHRLNMGTRASQTTVLHSAALPRYSTSATQTEAVGRQHFSASKRGEKINHSGWAFVPICHGAAITIPFPTLFVSQTKVSGCDSESNFLCRLFMQLNHYNSSYSKWHNWHVCFEKSGAVRSSCAKITHLSFRKNQQQACIHIVCIAKYFYIYLNSLFFTMQKKGNTEWQLWDGMVLNMINRK